MFTHQINIVLFCLYSKLPRVEWKYWWLIPLGNDKGNGLIEGAWGGGYNGDSQLVICNWNWNKIGSESKPSGGTFDGGGGLHLGAVCWNMGMLEWRIFANHVRHKRFFHIFDNDLRMKFSPNRAGCLQKYLGLGSRRSRIVWCQFYKQRSDLKIPQTKFLFK